MVYRFGLVLRKGSGNFNLTPTVFVLKFCRALASAGRDLKGSVFLEALAEREEANRNGKMTVQDSLLLLFVGT